MCCRTGTFCHGRRLGGSRMMPAGMSIVPGVATPMAAIWSRRRPAAATACRTVSHICSRPYSCPFDASVGRLIELRAGPVSSTTPPFLVVPPTFTPTNQACSLMRTSFLSRFHVADHPQGQYAENGRERKGDRLGSPDLCCPHSRGHSSAARPAAPTGATGASVCKRYLGSGGGSVKSKLGSACGGGPDECRRLSGRRPSSKARRRAAPRSRLQRTRL